MTGSVGSICEARFRLSGYSLQYNHVYRIAWTNLAKIYLKMDNYNDALEAVDKSLEIDTNFEKAKKLREKIIKKIKVNM